MSLTPLIEQLRDFDTALIANTIGAIDPTPAHEYYMGGSIASLTPSLGPTVGVALTCELDTSTPGAKPQMEPWYELLKLMEKSADPTVLVIKTTGPRPDHECVIGDGMAKMMDSLGCIGLVTDGGVRDIEGIMTVPFAVYARQRTIHHCALRFGRINVPVEVGGITVSPGDVIHANIGGVLRIPPGCLAELPARATAMSAFEHDTHCVWRQAGVSIDEKRRAVADLLVKYGFGGPARR